MKVIRNSLATTSDSRAELAGIVEGLRRLRNPGLVRIYKQDLCTNVYLDKYLPAPSPIALNEFRLPEEDVDLWRDFIELAKNCRIELGMARHPLLDKDYDRALSAARRGLLSGSREWYVRNPGLRTSYGVLLF